jgi:uncharacterized protein YjaG (DUF416 family)
MHYDEYQSILEKQVKLLPFEKGLKFATKICQELMPDYIRFYNRTQYGDPEVLKKALAMCQDLQYSKWLKQWAVLSMISEVARVTPDTDMDDFYALNTGCAVVHCLQYLRKKKPSYLVEIGTMYSDRVEFRITNGQSIPREEVENNPEIVESRQYILDQTRL